MQLETCHGCIEIYILIVNFVIIGRLIIDPKGELWYFKCEMTKSPLFFLSLSESSKDAQ